MQKSAKSQKANTHRYREVFPSIRKNAPITQTQKKEPHAPPRSRRYNNSSVQNPSREKHFSLIPSENRQNTDTNSHNPTNKVVPPPLMKYTQRRVWSTSEKTFWGKTILQPVICAAGAEEPIRQQ
jgi:hypothetical protein